MKGKISVFLFGHQILIEHPLSGKSKPKIKRYNPHPLVHSKHSNNSIKMIPESRVLTQ